jgi:hypothetical protein
MRLCAECALVGALALSGCSKNMAATDGSLPSDGAKTDGPPMDVPGHTPGMPGLGGHAMNFYHLNGSDAPTISVAMSTQQSGSMIVVGVGRGYAALFADPTDNKGNTYQRLGSVRPYNPPYANSGTAVYSVISANGGADFRLATTNGKNVDSNNSDEITVGAVEVIEGTNIQGYVWSVVSGAPNTSDSVTTTGPATLIAFWWGDGFPGTPQSATPNNGFTVVDTNAQERDSFVQCAVAVKNVTAAGTYNVTWTPTPAQGAQLWLIAVQ